MVLERTERELVCYPYVLGRRRRMLRASEVPADPEGCFCLGCGSSLEVRDGRVGHPVADGECRPERAVREAARLAVRDGFLAALGDGGEYLVGVGCHGCSELASPVGLVGRGAELRFGERGEVVFSLDGGSLVVDFVGPGAEGQAAMLVEDSAVPVYRVELRDFRCVADLRGAAVAAGGLCVDVYCPACLVDRRREAAERQRGCDEERERRRVMLEERDREIRLDARASVRGIVRERQPGVMFGPWYHGRGGAALSPAVQRLVFANAVLLTECGFGQHNPEKPWLFRRGLSRGISAFADLGGAGLSVEGREPRVGLFVMGMEPEETALRDLIRGEIERRLREAGVDVSGDGGTGPSEAVWRVDRDLVNSLVESGELPPDSGAASVDSISRWRGDRAAVSPARAA